MTRFSAFEILEAWARDQRDRGPDGNHSRLLDVPIQSMDHIVDALASYTTASPARRAAAIIRLESTLKDLVVTAQRETAEFTAGEGLGH